MRIIKIEDNVLILELLYKFIIFIYTSYKKLTRPEYEFFMSGYLLFFSFSSRKYFLSQGLDFFILVDKS